MPICKEALESTLKFLDSGTPNKVPKAGRASFRRETIDSKIKENKGEG